LRARKKGRRRSRIRKILQTFREENSFTSEGKSELKAKLRRSEEMQR
jgi:hypothetical protein